MAETKNQAKKSVSNENTAETVENKKPITMTTGSDANVSLRNTTKLLIIGFGQAGGKLAAAIAQKTKTPVERVIAINTSEADLRSINWVTKRISISTLKPGAASLVKGAGKDRRKVYDMLQQLNGDILKEIASLSKDTGYEFIITCFSADGGTGSGSGPAMTAMLSSNGFQKPFNCPVMGICALPDHRVGTDAIQNTLDCLDEMNKYLKANYERVMFVDNDVYGNVPDDVERYAQINEAVSELIERYLYKSFVSSQNLDFADRETCLLVPQQHALVKFNASTGEWFSPFIVPEGSNVRKMASESPIGYTETRALLNNSIGCTVNDDSYRGFYKDGVDGAYPVAHYAGFLNIEKISLKYQGWFSQKQQEAERQSKIDAERGRGFASLSENKKFLDKAANTDGDFSFENLIGLANS